MLQAIEPAKKLRLVILDACRDNPFARTMKRSLGRATAARGLAGVEPGKPNTLIAFAARGGSIADDGFGANSPYTTALLAHLAKPDLDLRKAFGLVRDDVIKATGSKQEPFLYGSLGGADVVLMKRPNNQPARIQVAENPAQVGKDSHGEARRDYELALQLGTKQAWTSYLEQYQQGLFASLARGQLEKIVAEEARVAERHAKQAAEDNARTIVEQARSEAKAILERAEAGALAAQDARKAAEDEVERLRKLIARMESGGLVSRTEPARPQAASGQIFCDSLGCRPLRPGCRVLANREFCN